MKIMEPGFQGVASKFCERSKMVYVISILRFKVVSVKNCNTKVCLR